MSRPAVQEALDLLGESVRELRALEREAARLDELGTKMKAVREKRDAAYRALEAALVES